MSPILLDTSAYSAALRGEARMVETGREADEISLSAVILGELKAGFARGRHREKNAQELARFLVSPRVRVLEVDEETSDRYAVILNSLRSSGTPIPTNDVWIAATAMQHGLRVVTTDQHFLKVRQILVDFLGKEIG